MSTSEPARFERLVDVVARFGRPEASARFAGDAPPLRSALFSADQMEQHGRHLAGVHRLAPAGRADTLLSRLAENERVLVEVCDFLTAAVTTNRRITPAAEWLLDNFYLIDEQIRTAKRHLPRRYSRELPRLAHGPSARLPRVYDLAFEAISHGDGRVDAETLSRFVAAYQSVSPLSLGELWAIPIMLRLALIENLRRVGARVAAGAIDRNHADVWADQMLDVAERDPKSLILVIADMARSHPPMVSSFVAELARRLQGQSAALALPLTWIEQRLSESGLTIEQLVHVETQEQASNQVSISNTIGSLRFLGAMDWREFVETMSVVEAALRQDPGGHYAQMDFATRDRYRHVVESIAKASDRSERDVAQCAVRLARDAAAAAGGAIDDDVRDTHVGYYLVDAGKPQLEREVEMRRRPGDSWRRTGRHHALAVYLAAIGAITAIVAGTLLAAARGDGLSGGWLAAFGVVVILSTSQLAVGVVNWLATLLVTPRPLPRMDFSGGIPAASRTLVVVPTMIDDADGVESLLEALEVRFLANREEHLHFGLLTDFKDAETETQAGDAALLDLARRGIEALNDKYRRSSSANADTFFLFHRPRRWNPRERTWMGRERKRGKLADLNALLRGRGDGRFQLVVGDTAVLAGVRYVITLDTDTQLPRDAGREFAGAMAHPLNRPRFAASGARRAGGLVDEGYGILQPRVSISLPAANRSWYSRLNGGDPGVDPYTRAVSDVYQDAFGEGSFVGKGIYDVDAFERSAGDFPDNTILSHDLLEGCYARSGLLSDVQLYEEYPSTYRADIARRHRWIRGDWQLAGWLLPFVPGPEGRRVRNPLSALSLWKLADNLRRSLVPPALTLMLLLGWTVLSHPWLWTLAVVAIVALPPAAAVLVDLLRKSDETLLRQHLAAVAASAGRHAAHVALALAFLPFEATVNLDAIARTAWRMLVSRRRLLEWSPSRPETPARNGAGALRDGPSVGGTFAWMGIAPLIAIAAAIVIATTSPAAMAAAVPILALWLASPILTWRISQPDREREVELTADQTRFLRKLARRTWAFFETYVGPDDQWLPPDNVQEHPATTVAHRTSPTNMGLALLANLTACDFGFIPPGQLVERTANTLRTLAAMERFEGHFYNWYDTQTLKPLAPLYVSTVDSGNLAGHLMTLRPGLLGLADDPIVAARWLDGLADTLHVLVEALDAPAAPSMVRVRKELDLARASPPATLGAAQRLLDRLDAGAAEIAAHVAGLPIADVPAPVRGAGDASFWSAALARQCRVLRDELAFLAPWSASPGGDGDPTDVLGIPTLRELASLDAERLPGREDWRRLAAVARQRAGERLAEIERLAQACEALARMEYDFLYDDARHLLAIGYNVGERRRDASHYDLLASEARLASFVAIAQGQVPQENWFALGRLLTSAAGRSVLLSWSGSMFEYLMPLLVMPSYGNTLLDRTSVVTVERQIAYGKQRGVPWGISECGYNTVDAALNYQYRAFGVPGLGMKRGLSEDLVIAPYASALALMVAPEAATQNLQRLANDGLAGRFGLYEAIDYTPARVPRGQASAVVRSFMAHHQGMILLSLAHRLLGRPLQRRFESDPEFRATLLLLQERVPRAAGVYSPPAELSASRGSAGATDAPVRIVGSADTPIPEVQLLSNGRYHVMVTNAGGGSSRWKDLAVTRWREDGTRDDWGTFLYLRDVETGEFWSAAHQPTSRRATSYEAIFSEARAEFRRRDGDLESHTEIVVSPEDDIEIRRLRITNHSKSRRLVDVTSYAEVALAPPAADALHPAFSNLFVQTEILPGRGAILCTRRPRSRSEASPWMFHQMTVHGATSLDASCETDRMAFIGRGRNVGAPRAMLTPGSLAGGQGSVLDPIVAVRHRLALDPQGSATIDLVTGIAETRDAAVALAGRYQDRHLADRVFDLAWTHSSVTLRQINATESDAQLYARLASSVIYANASLRAEGGVIARNRRGQSGLWSYAISGDLPIVLLQIGDADNIDLVRQMVQAHAYWRLKGLAVDLVIWNEDRGGYRQVLQDQIMGLIAAGIEAHVMDRPGGIFVRRAEQIADEDRILLQSVARAIVTDRRGSLVEQVGRRSVAAPRVPRLVPSKGGRSEAPVAPPPARDLILFNGLGGFTPDGTEYVVTTKAGQTTPMPWSNVIANPAFGSVISESGSAYTWSENAHEFRLTPWHNDAVGDASGEAFYLRDDESGQFWSPSALPSRGSGDYVTRHGFGYSVFEHVEDGIASELWVYVSLVDAVKYSVLKVRNGSGRPRRLSATGYVEWVLGDLPPKTAMHVITEVDARGGALLARNQYNREFPDRVAFFDVDDASRSATGDRTEFIGRNGTLVRPAAMGRTKLSGKVGAALDPCAALQVPFELADGQQREFVFTLGMGRNTADATQLVQRVRGPLAAGAALEAVRNHWSRMLGAVQVRTADPSLDVLVNGWLVYQAVACRLWARSGYYQSGGAYGFRDQLQDAMALVHADPALLREQLIRCAGRQFVEGDVQHWWHPPSGRGVRTRCSDDYLWLPLATARYLKATGDREVLDHTAAFLDGRPVNEEDDAYYDLPRRSQESATVYEHCVRALVHGLRYGVHGLPLMGSGDWNDGMNRVGIKGAGESVWLGFFLCTVLREFADVARLKDDLPFAELCEAEVATLRASLERHAWDGAWYRRAYFDDGTPLGSATGHECQIDSISQSWSVLSGAADAGRSRSAMKALDERLVRRADGLVRLLDPPFDTSDLDPGYIRGYVPGVRENGGQYTHGAIWAAMAFAAMGDGTRAWELATMLNPVNHARTPQAVATYQVEPYVVAADVYAFAPHIGRGGWTWYTGSAGWMYRLIVESLLGLSRESDRLRIAPCLPATWTAFTLRYRHGATYYDIAIRQAAGGDAATGTRVTVDGVAQADDAVPLVDDGADHDVVVEIPVGGTGARGPDAP